MVDERKKIDPLLKMETKQSKISYLIYLAMLHHNYDSRLFVKSKECKLKTIAQTEGTQMRFSNVNFHGMRKHFRPKHGQTTLKSAMEYLLRRYPDGFFGMIEYDNGLHVLIVIQTEMLDGRKDIIVPTYLIIDGLSSFPEIIINGEAITKSADWMARKFTCESCKKRGDEKLKSCSKCMKVRYCDGKCQKDHWREHKKVCRK